MTTPTTTGRQPGFIERLAGVRPPDDNGLPPVPKDAPRGREASQLLAVEQLQELKILSQSMSEFAVRMQGFTTDLVLGVETVIIPAEGFVHRQYKAPIGAVVVRNLSANPMTVFDGGPSSGPPTSGHGVWIIPANTKDTIAVGGVQFTIFGTAADKCGYQAVARGITPVG